ncbi:MAG: carboxypeptidase regulatory-like domain-containing protein [Candidatus Cloacimonetes bacterium]|nr:carboxypeptidase regulatory-like domain-containing protein [Candidatus Cloacimonadota bacterium]
MKKIIFIFALILISILWSQSEKVMNSSETSETKKIANSSKTDETEEVKNSEYASVQGHVVSESHRSLKNVYVSIGKFSRKTDKAGYFRIEEVPFGTKKITFSKSKYETISENFKIDSNSIDVGQIVLKKETKETKKIKESKKKKKKTGRFAGKIIDEKKQPIPFASVIIEGTSIGAQSDEKGKYVIINIPIGTYSIIFQQAGYQTKKLTHVKINIDETTIANITLSTYGISVEGFMGEEHEIEQVSATKTGSGKTLTSESIEDLGVADIGDITSLQAGVSEVDGEVHVRGGRENEVSYSTDGMSVSDPINKKEKEAAVAAAEANPLLEELRLIREPRKQAEKELESYDEEEIAELNEDIKEEPIATPKPTFKKKKQTKSGLKASYVDDNKQFNHFLDFLEKHKYARHLEMDVSERYIIKCVDKQSRTIPDIPIKVYDEQDKMIEQARTYSDGTYLFFPKFFSKNDQKFSIYAEYNNSAIKLNIDQQDPRMQTIQFELQYVQPQNTPLDILFILDTTGSMGEEINRLKSTIEIINMNIVALSPKPQIRFGMVLYKDIRDSYVTKIIPFTNDLNEFETELAKVSAAGGGDTPEDLQTALKDALRKMEWRKNGGKLGFIITDAAPHLDYNQEFSYVNACVGAKSKGIKLFSIGTGGLDINGEYVLRQISQFTSANYVFLTYGEKGESSGGKPGSVSHHTGENFQTDKLEAILIQIIKRELKQFSGLTFIEDDYIEANPIDDEKNEETLEKLFSMAITQLKDYSTIQLDKDTPTAISPIITTSPAQKATAEYFYENLVLTLANDDSFKAVARQDLQPVLDELRFQLDELSNEENAAELGKFMGAKLLITGKIYSHNKYYEVFLKLMNVETVEILSVTKLKINRKLGL